MVATDCRPKAAPGDGRPLWVDLASVIAGERLDRRAAVVLAIALAAVATAAVVLLITRQGVPAHHLALH
jgi:hypothetical protein